MIPLDSEILFYITQTKITKKENGRCVGLGLGAAAAGRNSSGDGHDRPPSTGERPRSAGGGPGRRPAVPRQWSDLSVGGIGPSVRQGRAAAWLAGASVGRPDRQHRSGRVYKVPVPSFFSSLLSPHGVLILVSQ